MSGLFILFVIFCTVTCHFDNVMFVSAPTPVCPQHIGPPCPRNYNNTMPDYKPGDNTTISAALKQKMSTYMDLYMNLILKNSPPTNQYSDSTILSGVAGHAVMFFRVYKNTGDKQYLGHAKDYIEAALKITTPTPTGDVGFLASYTGTYTMAAIIYAEIGDMTQSTKYVRLMQTAMKESLLSNDDTFDTGRAGTLFCAHLLNNVLGEATIPKEDILKMAYLILENGIKQGKDGHLSWKNSVFPDIIFWGQGHGSTGVIQQLLEIPDFVANQTAANYLKATLDYYLTLQLPNGNFPTPQIPPYPDEPDTLVQWCHGAPGFMAILTKGYAIFNNPKYLQSADRAADCNWQRGILTKGLMLCHGVAGNTYMFLYMYEQTKNLKHLYRAIKFQEYTLSQPIMVDPNVMRQPTPTPYQFFQGSYGSAVVLWSDMLTPNSPYHMPGFDAYP